MNKSYHSENQSKKQIDAPAERVAVVRSAHGRADETFCTVASFIVSADGARLLAGRHVTKRTPANVLQFPQRPRPTSPTHTRREVA